MRGQRTSRIELALKAGMPEAESLFQALDFTYWQFQGLAATEMFMASSRPIEERLWTDLIANNSGGFRHKGRQCRTWRLPFGTMKGQGTVSEEPTSGWWWGAARPRRSGGAV